MKKLRAVVVVRGVFVRLRLSFGYFTRLGKNGRGWGVSQEIMQSFWIGSLVRMASDLDIEAATIARKAIASNGRSVLPCGGRPRHGSMHGILMFKFRMAICVSRNVTSGESVTNVICGQIRTWSYG